MNDDELVSEVREMARAGASFLDVVKHIHARKGAIPFSRGIVMFELKSALGLSIPELSDLLACDIFGDHPTTTLQNSERLFAKFRERL